MKKVVKASSYTSDRRTRRFIDEAVWAAANNEYDNCGLSDDDPRCDYFVANVALDSDVALKKQELLDAIAAAVKRQMRR